MSARYLVAPLAVGILFLASARAAGNEVELRAEIQDAAGQVVAKPVLRLRLGEPAAVTVIRGTAEYHLRAEVEGIPGPGCHTVRVSLREPGAEKSRDTISALCGERPVSLVRPGGATLGLQLVAVR